MCSHLVVDVRNNNYIDDVGRGPNNAAAASAVGDDWSDEEVCVLELNPVYAVVSSAVSFYLPCLAMLFIYFRLHRYARRQVDSIKMTLKYAAPTPKRAALPVEVAVSNGQRNSTDRVCSDFFWLLRRQFI